MDLSDFLDRLGSHRRASLVALDFDGTLAEIVDDPGSARPVAGVTELLERLAGQLGEVAVVSGRPVGFLSDRFVDCPSITLVGLYGLELCRAGQLEEHPDTARWRVAVQESVRDLSDRLPDGAAVEDKGASLTVHYRAAPTQADRVTAAAREVATGTGLELRHAKMSIELHPPVRVDKGTVLADLSERHGGPVCFIGDDLGDLRAFDALDELEALGRPTLRVAVSGAETPPALLERADEVVDGPNGAVGLLSRFED